MPSSRTDLSDRILKCSRNGLYRPVDNGSSDASLYRLQSLRRLACMVFAGRHQNSGANSSKRGTHAGHAVLNCRYEGTLRSPALAPCQMAVLVMQMLPDKLSTANVRL